MTANARSDASKWGVETFEVSSETSRTWRDRGDAWTFDDMLNEEHHRQYGRPWCVGRGYFECLIELGLMPAHHVLDFGCGAGRVGVHLLPYLEPNRYVGMDRHLGSLEAFSRYEVPLHGLRGKHGRIIHDDSVSLDRIGTVFDFILDFSVTHHMRDSLSFYAAAVRVLAPRGMIVMTHTLRPSVEELSRLGLKITRSFERESFLLSDREVSTAKDNWNVTSDTWRLIQRK